MCGIFCSSDPLMLRELSKLNHERAGEKWSISGIRYNFDYNNRKGHDVKLGTVMKCDWNMLLHDWSQFPRSSYYIGHIVASTFGERENLDTVHPAIYEDSVLWHNGILKDLYLSGYKGSEFTNWDTMLLLIDLVDKNDWRAVLSEVKGSFACLLIHKGYLFAFRNELSPLFYDCEFNISSVKFPSDKGVVMPFEPYVFHKIDLAKKEIEKVGVFERSEIPTYHGLD